MPKTSESSARFSQIHEDYPDPMPSQKEILAAFNSLLGTLENEQNNKDYTKKVHSVSMAEIYYQARNASRKSIKNNKNSNKTKYPETNSNLTKIQSIYEKPTAKAEGLAILEKLKLPRYRKISLTIKDFLKAVADEKKLESSSSIFDQLQATNNRYYPSISTSDGRRYFELNLTKEQVIKFVKELLKNSKKSRQDSGQTVLATDTLTLSEFYQNIFAFNLIIMPRSNEPGLTQSGSIKIELVKGEHRGLAYGNSQPIIRAETDLFDRFTFEINITEFSLKVQKLLSKELSKTSYVKFPILAKFTKQFDKHDQEIFDSYLALVEKILYMISLIPKTEAVDNHLSLSHREKSCFPGYYEGIIVNKEGEEQNERTEGLAAAEKIRQLAVLFIDYRPDDNYQI